MRRWNTDEVERVLSAIDGAEIKRSGRGGDHDTTAIWVDKNGGSIGVFAMDTVDVIDSPDDTDYEILFVGAGERYGMENATPEDFPLCGEIMSVLEAAEYPSPSTSGWKAYF
jgi:hypothetical protein